MDLPKIDPDIRKLSLGGIHKLSTLDPRSREDPTFGIFASLLFADCLDFAALPGLAIDHYAPCLDLPLITMPPKTTPFQPKHALEYGLELVKTEIGGLQTVRCLFCVYEGRDVVQVGSLTGRKRKSRNDIHYYRKPFAPQNYRSHNASQHTESWSHYSQLSQEDKATYFDNKEKRVNTLHHHMDLAADTLVFTVQPAIVETIIGDMFFRDDEELLDNGDEDEDEDEEAAGAAAVIAKKVARKAMERVNAMKLFVKDEETGKYTVAIKNITRYELALDHVGSGMSFRQTAGAIEHAKCRTHSAKLAGINDMMVGKFVRSLVASNLQRISDLMSHSSVWAFSFAGDSSTHRGNSFFDMRVRFCHRAVLANLHLVAIPMFDRHTAQIIFTMVCKFMDALLPPWRAKLISVASDGENTMTGRHSGLVTRLCAAAENHVLRIWCPPHQIDLVTKRAAEGINDGQWVKFAYTYSVYLRAQNNLITAMNIKCPKKTNRWVHLGRLLTFYKTYRRAIIAYTIDNRADNVPTDSFWVITYSISPAINKVNTTFAVLQNRALLLAQQEEFIETLVSNLVAMFSVESMADVVEEDGAQPDEHLVVGAYRVPRAALLNYVEDQGSFPMQCYERLDDDEKAGVLEQIASYAIELVKGISAVKAERDGSNRPCVSNAPPVLPGQLVKLRHGIFVRSVLDPYRAHAAKHWTEEMIDEIEEDHRALLKMYQDDVIIRDAIDKQDVHTLFNDAWDFAPDLFKALRSFCGGLASAFANTTSVESDFSILKWESNPNRTCMMHLSLEGIFQSKQRAVLESMTHSQ